LTITFTWNTPLLAAGLVYSFNQILLDFIHYGYYIPISLNDINSAMIRDLELAFIKLHILHHSEQGEVFGIGLMEELSHHGYRVGPGTLYPTLAKMETQGLLSCEARTVNRKQRKYYRITRAGRNVLKQMRRKIYELHQEVAEGT
jgi:DNA-binding PadR family transcriptional regulator